MLSLNCNILFASDPTLTSFNLYYAAYCLLHDEEDPCDDWPDETLLFDFDCLDLDEDIEDVSLGFWFLGHPYPRWEQVATSMKSEEQAGCVVRKYIEGEWHAIVFSIQEE